MKPALALALIILLPLARSAIDIPIGSAVNLNGNSIAITSAYTGNCLVSVNGLEKWIPEKNGKYFDNTLVIVNSKDESSCSVSIPMLEGGGNQPIETSCNDGIDNDNDGAIDYADPNCVDQRFGILDTAPTGNVQYADNANTYSPANTPATSWRYSTVSLPRITVASSGGSDLAAPPGALSQNTPATSWRYSSISLPRVSIASSDAQDQHNYQAPSNYYNYQAPSNYYNYQAPSNYYNYHTPADEHNYQVPSNYHDYRTPSQNYYYTKPSASYDYRAPSGYYNYHSPSSSYDYTQTNVQQLDPTIYYNYRTADGRYSYVLPNNVDYADPTLYYAEGHALNYNTQDNTVHTQTITRHHDFVVVQGN